MLHTYTLAALRDGLARGDFSSRELTQHFLQRISQYDGALNSFITYYLNLLKFIYLKYIFAY